MKAIILREAGGVESLLTTDIEKPQINKSEVLVEVKAISVNPVDFKVRGAEPILNMIYGEERPAILGWDISGVVVKKGSEVNNFEIGDRVFGMINFVGKGKAYAEYVAAPADQLAKIPREVTFYSAAASTLAALTALQVLQDKIKPNDRVLIHAGSGGVGHFAIQIAKSMGAFVITTSSTKNKELVLSFGADQHIDYQKQAFEKTISNVDFVFDMFNGDVLFKSIQIAKEGGTVISIPTPDFAEEIKALAKEKNVILQFHMVQSNGNDMQTIAGLLENGAIKPHISKAFSFDEMRKAHEQLESGRTVGKVIVTL
ncbi:MAG: NADP-dependent oxidoreductase [Bacteroidota bacterium]